MRISDWSSDVCSSDLGTNVSIQLLDDQSTESAEAFTVQINGAPLAVSGTQLQIFDASGTGTIAASATVLLYDTTAFGCPDPAGLTYDPSHGQPLLVAPEVAERPFFCEAKRLAPDP